MTIYFRVTAESTQNIDFYKGGIKPGQIMCAYDAARKFAKAQKILGRIVVCLIQEGQVLHVDYFEFL